MRNINYAYVMHMRNINLSVQLSNFIWQEYCSELYQHITTADQQALDEIVSNLNNQNAENDNTEPPISIRENKTAP